MLRSLAVAAALSIAVPAAAQDAPAEPADGGGDRCARIRNSISAPSSISLTDYRFRGVSRSDEDPAVQAAINLNHSSGLYAGVRGTSLAGTTASACATRPSRIWARSSSISMPATARELGDGFELDAGLLYYLFAGGDGATDYVEPYASLSYLIGPIYATAGAKYAPSQDAIGDEDMLYLFGQVDVSIPFRPWRFSALVGHQDWGSFGSYWTWSLGGRYQLRIEGFRISNRPALRRHRFAVDDGQDAGMVGSIGLRF